jgi:hypothetical protein
VLIGDSYNAGPIELLGWEINLPVCHLTGGGQTAQRFKDFLRDPGLLEDCKVVV